MTIRALHKQVSWTSYAEKQLLIVVGFLAKSYSSLCTTCYLLHNAMDTIIHPTETSLFCNFLPKGRVGGYLTVLSARVKVKICLCVNDYMT